VKSLLVPLQGNCQTSTKSKDGNKNYHLAIADKGIGLKARLIQQSAQNAGKVGIKDDGVAVD
jgi:hypothetical protein